MTVQNGEMVVESNGIPNHDFLSTRGCCAPEKDYTAYITLTPENDTTGGHTTTNCPASAGRWECAPASEGSCRHWSKWRPYFWARRRAGGDAMLCISITSTKIDNRLSWAGVLDILQVRVVTTTTTMPIASIGFCELGEEMEDYDLSLDSR